VHANALLVIDDRVVAEPLLGSVILAFSFRGGAGPADELSAKGAWAVELEARCGAGPVAYGGGFRLRHVPSGKYLSVDTTRPAKNTAAGPSVLSVAVADDDGEGNSNSTGDSTGCEGEENPFKMGSKVEVVKAGRSKYGARGKVVDPDWQGNKERFP